MKPILFNTEMVRAILDGRKTMTRRPVKQKYSNSVLEILNGHLHECEPKTPDIIHEDGSHTMKVRLVIPCKAPYQKGDILYVRETWAKILNSDRSFRKYVYATDGYPSSPGEYIVKFKWRPSIHMPKEAARIFLRVTDDGVERVQEITEEGAKAEGVKPALIDGYTTYFTGDNLNYRDGFMYLWQEIYSKTEFMLENNPYDWVNEFEIVQVR